MLVSPALKNHPPNECETGSYAVEAEKTDRAFWEKRRDPASLEIMDKIVSALKTAGISANLSYKKNDIPLGSTGNNFCWFNPRKTPGYCRILVRLTPELQESALSKLQVHGVDASTKGARAISFSATNKELNQQLEAILEVIKQAEKLSR